MMLRSFIRRALAVLASATLAYVFAVAPVHAASITYSDPNCSSFTISPSGVVSCVPVSTTPGAPSGCSISANPASLSAPGSVSLTATCGGGAVSSWTWSGPTSATSGNTATANISATSTFSVTAENANGKATAAVTVSVAAAGGGGGGGPISCNGFAATHVVDMNWASPTRMVSGMGPNDAIVVRFTTGAQTSSRYTQLSGAEWGSSPSPRVATLSTQPCDFGAGLNPPSTTMKANTVRFQFSVGLANSSGGYYPTLNTNTTYYLTITNVTPSTCQSNGVCNMFIDLYKASGL